MKLFKWENWKLHISEEAYLIAAFKAVIDRDKSANKDRAMKELGFIYFFIDPRSDYSFITDLAERKASILLQQGMPTNWEPDAVVKQAMDTYKFLVQTSSSILLEETRSMIDKIKEYLSTLDLNSKDDKGKPLYPVSTIISAIKQIPQLAKDISEAEVAINKEIEEAGRIRGNKAKKVLEDGYTTFVSNGNISKQP
jgi:hypothetical protein